jgi:hypothetical protein
MALSRFGDFQQLADAIYLRRFCHFGATVFCHGIAPNAGFAVQGVTDGRSAGIQRPGSAAISAARSSRYVSGPVACIVGRARRGTTEQPWHRNL